MSTAYPADCDHCLRFYRSSPHVPETLSNSLFLHLFTNDATLRAADVLLGTSKAAPTSRSNTR